MSRPKASHKGMSICIKLKFTYCTLEEKKWGAMDTKAKQGTTHVLPHSGCLGVTEKQGKGGGRRRNGRKRPSLYGQKASVGKWDIGKTGGEGL